MRHGSILVVALALATVASAQYNLPKLGEQGALPPGARPPQLLNVGIQEHLGAPVDLGLTFIGENGYPVRLGDYFNQGRPVILNLLYYNCPMLCTLILNGQVEAMRNIPWTPGKDYDIVTITIDPRETFADARKKKTVYLASYDRPAPGWHFLADDHGHVKQLAEQVGFNYNYDPRIGQYAHAAAIMILTPEGRMARYLYGIRFSPRDMRFAMAEASAGRSTMALEKILLFCYHYDPKASGYVLFALNLMRAGGVVTVIVISLFLRFMLRAERRRKARLAELGFREKEGYA